MNSIQWAAAPRQSVLLAICFLSFSIPSQPTVFLQIGSNYSGASFGVDSPALPPDASGAVGPTNFVMFINGRFSVFDKHSGTRIQTMADRDFWINAGVGLPSNLDVSDPRILYDPASQRWFACQVDLDRSNEITNRFLLAVSATPNPTLAWAGFAFLADPRSRSFADFPTLGLDASGVYLGAELFDETGNDLGPTVVSFPKSDLLASPPGIASRTSLGALSLLKFGAIPQPSFTVGAASTPETVLAIGDLGRDFEPHSTLAAFVIEPPADNGRPSLTASKILSVPEYLVPLNPPQPNGLNNLDNGDARISSGILRVGDIAYAVHSTEVNKRAAIQWIKINARDLSVLQTGIIADTNVDLFYPSIAANSSGVAVIACNGSSLNSFVSSYAMAGETINGQLTFGPLQLLKSGTASFVTSDSAGTSRWGDYSTTMVDPTNPDHFWTIQVVPTRRSAWTTQITELIASPLRLTIAGSASNAVISWPASAAGYQLQSSVNLASSNWVVAQNPTQNGTVFQLALPASDQQRFFRLIKP